MSTVNLPHVLYEKQGPVLTIQMDWAEGKNAMDWQSMDSLAKIYQNAAIDETLKLIILKGSAGYFNTGGHVDTADDGDKEKYQDALERLTAARKALPIPTLAAVNGHCLAGGMMFLADADFAVSLDTARYAFPEILHGAFPIMVMSPLIDVIPKKKALEVFCSGREFSAQEALAMGLLNQVVPAKDFDRAVKAYADMVCSIDRDVLSVGRKCYYEMAALPAEARHECGMRALREVWEAKEAAKRNRSN